MRPPFSRSHALNATTFLGSEAVIDASPCSSFVEEIDKMLCNYSASGLEVHEGRQTEAKGEMRRP